jgi:hypothetical protein
VIAHVLARALASPDRVSIQQAYPLVQATKAVVMYEQFDAKDPL